MRARKKNKMLEKVEQRDKEEEIKYTSSIFYVLCVFSVGMPGPSLAETHVDEA